MTRTSNARVLTAYDIMLANERARADIEWEKHNGMDALRAASETDGVPYRPHGRGVRRVRSEDGGGEAGLTATQAIRAKCVECNCGVKAEVKHCTLTDCPLYPFRMGHNPNYQRKSRSLASKSSRFTAQENLQEDE